MKGNHTKGNTTWILLFSIEVVGMILKRRYGNTVIINRVSHSKECSEGRASPLPPFNFGVIPSGMTMLLSALAEFNCCPTN